VAGAPFWPGPGRLSDLLFLAHPLESDVWGVLVVILDLIVAGSALCGPGLQ
jgi:hypothetical protein